MLSLTIILTSSQKYKEGFFDFPDTAHNAFVKESEVKYDPLATTINPIQPSIPINTRTAALMASNTSGIKLVPSSNTYLTVPDNKYRIPDNVPGSFERAKSCEDAGNTCAAFNDPTFATNCGMSFDQKGTGAGGNPHVGGMYISSENRVAQIQRAANVLETGSAPYDPYKVYQPTFGKAKPGTFAITKDQCVIVKERVDCEAKQSFNSPNCTQCYSSQKFSRLDPKTGRLPSTLFLFGNGSVRVSSTDKSITLKQTNLDVNKPVQVNIPATAEGTAFSIIVELDKNGTPPPFIAGYIQGPTSRGDFKMDMMTLIQADQVSQSKPRVNGSINANGFKSLSIIPGIGQSYMNLSCLMPFTFLNMYDGDTLMCENGPVITKASSATFLDSDPCFSISNKPGNYKLECLQARWVDLGGTRAGTGYPSNQTKADDIQKDVNGNPLDIDTIVDILMPKMTSARTGKDPTGKPLSLAEWNAVSTWATGKSITTVCDGPAKDSGPLSPECLSYLYLNKGVSSHIGATYTLASSSVASMIGQLDTDNPNTYCRPGTIMDPSTVTGLAFGQKLGGVDAVKKVYDDYNRLANDNTKTNAQREEAIKMCYGIKLD